MTKTELLKKMILINENIVNNYLDILTSLTFDIDIKNHEKIEQIYNISLTIQNLKDKIEKQYERLQIEEGQQNA